MKIKINNKQEAMELIKKHPRYLAFVPKTILDKEIVLFAASLYGWDLESLYKTRFEGEEDVAVKAVKMSSSNYKYIPSRIIHEKDKKTIGGYEKGSVKLVDVVVSLSLTNKVVCETILKMSSEKVFELYGENLDITAEKIEEARKIIFAELKRQTEEAEEIEK